MHEVLVNRLGGLSLPRKSVVRLTDRPDMTLDVYRGHKTIQCNNNKANLLVLLLKNVVLNWFLLKCKTGGAGPSIKFYIRRRTKTR